MMRAFIIAVFSFTVLGKAIGVPRPINYVAQVKASMLAIDMVMIHDVVNPPAAARYYTYCSMAAYNIVTAHGADTSIKPLETFVRSYKNIQVPFTPGSDYRIAAIYSIYESARLLLPSGYMIEDYQAKYIESLQKAGVADAVIKASVKVAEYVAQQIVVYSKTDNYNKLSTYVRYTPKKGDSAWNPTPPAYMEAVEPHWQIVRPLVLDSSSEFIPQRPVAFDKDSASHFHALAMEVYNTSKHLTKEQTDIANFWDCNPFAVQNDGHMLIGLKKISPGAHWMGITAIACKQAKTGFSKTVQINTAVAIGLLDGFICCWEDKYRTNRIRPETAIRRYIDPHWKPLLQTPPFPEYISGHSVVSTTAAVILTHYLGDNFKYTDDVEVSYGIPPRHFSSFTQAAKEAAISRFWGGIHFMDAIDNGIIQGNKVGNLVVAKLSGQKKS